MGGEAHDLWLRIYQVLEFPLVTLGDSNLTLLGIFKFLFLLFLVFGSELMVRKYFVLRLLQRTRLEDALQYAVSKIAGYIFIALGIYVALKLVGIDLSSLAVIAGAVGVGIGFGLQTIISNFISGLIILAEQPIAIGNYIEVDGVKGIVRQINLRATTIVTNDNITIIVPNSNFITNKVVNWSHGDARVQIRLPVGIAYGTDIATLRRVLLAVAAAHPLVLKDPAPTLYFDGFGDSAMNFELGVWTIEMTTSPRRFRSELYFAMEQALRENNIEIPFPQRDLRIRSGSLERS